MALDLVGRLGSSGSAAVLVEGWLLVLVTGSGELTDLLAVLLAGLLADLLAGLLAGSIAGLLAGLLASLLADLVVVCDLHEPLVLEVGSGQVSDKVSEWAWAAGPEGQTLAAFI